MEEAEQRGRASGCAAVKLAHVAIVVDDLAAAVASRTSGMPLSHPGHDIPTQPRTT
jgi:hypothetical protein